MLFHIGVVVFAGGVIFRTYAQYKKQIVSRYWLIAFSSVWLAIAGAALVPSATDVLARLVGVERGSDMLVYVAVLVLLYAVYRLFVRTQKMHEEMTELVRRWALAQPRIPKKEEELLKE